MKCKSFTLNFWPGLMLAILLRVGPGVALCWFSVDGTHFADGVIYGLGITLVFTGAGKLYRELRGV